MTFSKPVRPAPHTLEGWAVCLYGSTNTISLLDSWIQISDPKATNSMFTMLRPALAQASQSDSFRQAQGSAFLILPGEVRMSIRIRKHSPNTSSALAPAATFLLFCASDGCALPCLYPGLWWYCPSCLVYLHTGWCCWEGASARWVHIQVSWGFSSDLSKTMTRPSGSLPWRSKGPLVHATESSIQG